MEENLNDKSCSMKESFAIKKDEKKITPNKQNKKSPQKNKKMVGKTAKKEEKAEATKNAVVKADPKPINMSIDEYLNALGELNQGKCVNKVISKENNTYSKDKLYQMNELTMFGFNANETVKFFECINTNNMTLYKLKSPITIQTIGNKRIDIQNIIELIDILGISQRRKLEQEGLNIVLIDKYFDKTIMHDNKLQYSLKKQYINYKVIPYGNDRILAVIGKNENGEMIREKTVIYKNGSISKTRIVIFSETQNYQNKRVNNTENVSYPYSLEDLKDKYGFEEFEIKKYFDMNYKSIGKYRLKSSIIFNVQNNKKNITTIEELMCHAGINNRNELVKEGITLELIHKYFRTLPNENGEIEYRLIKNYIDYKITDDSGGNKVLELTKKNENSETIKEKIIIYKDGTFLNTNSINFSEVENTSRSNFRLFK